jgi:hypothetical protein
MSDNETKQKYVSGRYLKAVRLSLLTPLGLNLVEAFHTLEGEGRLLTEEVALIEIGGQEWANYKERADPPMPPHIFATMLWEKYAPASTKEIASSWHVARLWLAMSLTGEKLNSFSDLNPMVQSKTIARRVWDLAILKIFIGMAKHQPYQAYLAGDLFKISEAVRRGDFG